MLLVSLSCLSFNGVPGTNLDLRVLTDFDLD